MRISDAPLVLAVLLGAALPAPRASAQVTPQATLEATPPPGCVAAVEGGVFAGGWATFDVVLVPVTMRLDCPLTSEFTAGLDWGFVVHAVNSLNTVVPGNGYLHLVWSRQLGALRPTIGLGVVAPSTGPHGELATSGRARALAARGYLEPWLFVPETAWLVWRAGLVVSGPFLLEADAALAGHIAPLYGGGLAVQLAVALGARIASRVELGARLGFYGDVAGSKILPSYSNVEFSLMPFARVRVDRVRFEVGFVMNLGPGLHSGFHEKAFWSIRLGVAVDL